jgi:hypothetical protein
MVRPPWTAALLLGAVVAGCDYFRPPRLAITRGTDGEPQAETPAAAPGKSDGPAREVAAFKYEGRTAEQWRQVAEEPNLDKAYRACRALHVLGAEGRPYLVQALESPSPETRRLALETLSPADLRAFGDRGRRLLIQLAGDRSDMRIRQRATHYLAQWNNTPPAPP